MTNNKIDSIECEQSKAQKQDRIMAIRSAAGMWADREDLSVFSVIKEELDRLQNIIP